MRPRSRVDSDIAFSGTRVVSRYARALRWVTAAGTAAVVLGSLVSSAPPGYAGQGAEERPENLRQRLAGLTERAEALTKEYRGQLVHLDDAERAAERAATQAKRIAKRRDAASRDVSRVAAVRYATGQLGPLPMGGDPRTTLDRAATLDYLARQNQWKIRELQRLQEQARQARRDAQVKIDAVEDEITALEQRRDEVRALIERYREKARKAERARAAASATPTQSASPDRPSPSPSSSPSRSSSESPSPSPSGSASASASSSASSSASGSTSGSASAGGSGSTSSASGSTRPGRCPDDITERMCVVRNKIIQGFGEGPAVGCWRAGSSGEHPEGRACDFMLSTGGTPSSSGVQRGWDIAKWARNHAEDLGIMYVIYRQQIWDIRRGGGWRAMEDRGSVTANHYDHVHISVF